MLRDPHRAFRFRIEIDGIMQGSFKSVSGLERESTIETYREGGVNDFEHQHVVLSKYPPLRLNRGLVDFSLWDWHERVVSGDVSRRDVAIILLNDIGEQAWRWVCRDAFPAKWTGPELDATNSAVASETIELVHHGLLLLR